MRNLLSSSLLLTGVLLTGCSRSGADYVKAGNKLFDAGKFEDADLQYRKAIQKDPALGEAQFRRALAAEKQSKLSEMLQALSRAVELMPRNEAAIAKLADLNLLLYSRGAGHPDIFYNRVKALANQLVALNPQSVDGLRLKGDLALLDKHPDEAVAFLEKANRLREYDQDITTALFQALTQVGRTQDAEKLALKLIGRKPESGLAYDTLFRLYASSNRPDMAQKILEQKAQANPREGMFYLELAQYYAVTGKKDAMARTLQHVAEDTRDFPEGRLLVGRHYARMGDLEEARRQFEAGAQANPAAMPGYRIEIAKILLVQRKSDEALAVLDGVLKARPDSDETRLFRAETLLQLGTPETIRSAAAAAEEMQRRKPDDPALAYLLAKARLRNGDRKGAKTELANALRKRPDRADIKFMLASVDLLLGQFQEALRFSSDLVTSNPTDASYRLLRARALTLAGQHGEAQSLLTQLSNEFPRAAEVQAQIGILDIEEKKFAEAEKIFENLRKPGWDETAATVGLAEALTAQGEIDKAIRMLSEESKRSQDPRVRDLLIDAAVRGGKYDVAIAEYEKMRAANPQSAKVLIRLGEIYRSKGDGEKALLLFRQARQVAPQDPEAAVSLAEALKQSGKSDEALATYRDIAVTAPDDTVVLNNYAYLLCETGASMEQALRMATRAAEINPSQLVFRDTLACVYARKGMSTEALQIYNALVRQDPHNPTYRLHLATVLLGSDRPRARRELETALTDKPSAEDSAKIRELLQKLS